MPFKFQLFNLEHSCCNESNETNIRETMTKRKSSSKKVKSHRDKFTKAVQHCHKVTKGRKTFGSCMKKRLTKKGRK